jgi:1-acyl-sn-glycerol-3-phosphate acyltransferase
MTDTIDSLVAPSPGAPLRAAGRAASLVGTIGRLLATAHAEPAPAPGVLADRAVRTARAILAAHGVNVRMPRGSGAGAFVVVANHVSYLDPLVVSSVVPCISIAKGETSGWPLVGPGLRALGVVFVRRGDAHSGAVALRRAWRALRSGASVLNFPEGTTTDGRTVAAFQRGVFGLAILAGAPVLPVRLVYDDHRVPWFGGATFAPHYWKLAGVESLSVSVRVGDPIVPRAGDDATDLARRARAIVMSL